MKNVYRLARSAALVFDNIASVPSSVSFFSTGSPGNLKILLPSIDAAVTGCSCSSAEGRSLGSTPHLQVFNFSGTQTPCRLAGSMALISTFSVQIRKAFLRICYLVPDKKI
jgi:hypothetical protein